MADMKQLVSAFKAWDKPRDGVGDNPFKLACSLEEGATKEEVAEAWSDVTLPAELVEFWTHSRTARLFEDVDYGQWGLKVLSPAESAARTASERSDRPTDFGANDIVIGEFLGDQELLVLTDGGSEAEVLIALPLDPRDDWYRTARSLPEFLDTYLNAVGDKFWERAQ